MTGSKNRPTTKPVVFVNQFFYPDEAATSQILTDVVRGACCDDRITVVCGASGYAGGVAANASGEGGPGLTPWGIRVIRVGTARFGHGPVRKLLSYSGFYLGAAWATLSGERADVVVTMTTPPLLGLIGLMAQRWRGARHFIWEMDVYPDVAVELGTFRRGGMCDRVVGWLADSPRRAADGVIVLGPCMAERVRARGVPARKIFIAENWADGTTIRPQPFRNDGTLRVLYSGNLGLAHEFRTLVEALPEVERQGGVEFVFSGSGPRKAWLEAECRRFGCVRFGAFQPREKLGELLGLCDVGLVTQVPATLGCVVPSKVYGILAAGRPVLFVGPKAATPARIVERYRCGWQVEPGDAGGLARLLGELAERPERVREAGRRARAAFEAHYDLPIGVERIWEILGISEN